MNRKVHMPSRRDILRLGSAGLAAGVVGTPALSAARKPKKVARIAHLTDIHVQPELNAGEGMAKCLQHASSKNGKVDLVLFGGDMVMDTYGQTRSRTKTQWDLFKSVLKENCTIPVEQCIGNHDIWGWDKKASGTTGSEPDFGKKMALEMFEIPNRYRSFDRFGWHFVVLDSVQPNGEKDYLGRLDDEQFEWLQGDLAAVPKQTPILVISHIPILTATNFLDTKTEIEPGDFTISKSDMLMDCRRIVSLFAKYPNVKIALSGHIHMRDRVDFNGVSYLCDGAVCGSWWWGNHFETEPGYAVLDLFDDGTFQQQYFAWGWKREAVAPKAAVHSYEESVALMHSML